MPDELLPIRGCQNSERAGDVIFVHGLNGNPHDYWCHDGKPENYWPAWLGEDLPDIGVWSLGYENAAFKPLVFITHSMGGLLIKQLLRTANESTNPRWRAILERTRGVCFMATPQSGPT